MALGPKAGLFSTTATAADIDRIRAPLGQSTLTYVGWSYGAKLGAEYARLYPDKVRAAVLDAPTAPGTTWIETVERQIAGFERQLWGDVREFRRRPRPQVAGVARSEQAAG